MRKDKSPAARSLYEEILEQQYGPKAKKSKPKGPVSPGSLRLSSDFLINPPSKNNRSRTPGEENTEDPKGTLTQEERLIMHRVFMKYAEFKEPGGEPFLRLNRFKKLVFDGRLPASATAVELMFYGENRHQ